MNICAKYNGILYDAGFNSENEIILRSNNKNELNNGFIKYEEIFYKIVPKTELEELYEEHEFCTYRDIEFSIGGGTENTYTIFYWINDEKDKKMCESLKMEVYDKGIYVKEILKTEVTNYRIEKEDILHK